MWILIPLPAHYLQLMLLFPCPRACSNLRLWDALPSSEFDLAAFNAGDYTKVGPPYHVLHAAGGVPGLLPLCWVPGWGVGRATAVRAARAGGGSPAVIPGSMQSGTRPGIPPCCRTFWAARRAALGWRRPLHPQAGRPAGL